MKDTSSICSVLLGRLTTSKSETPLDKVQLKGSSGTEGRNGVGGVNLFTGCLPADDVSMAERMAMAAESAGIRANDPRRVRHTRYFPTVRIAQPFGESQPNRLHGVVESRSRCQYGGAGISRIRANAGICWVTYQRLSLSALH